MRMRVWVICAAASGLWAADLFAQVTPAGYDPLAKPTVSLPVFWEGSDSATPAESLVPPIWLSMMDEPPSVYPEIMPPRAEESINSGGVNFGLDVDLLSDYVYRGVEQSTTGFRSENALQFNAFAKFNLGKLPHPFIGLFVNVFNNDPISRFEEVRPYFGAEWTVEPLIIDAGFNSYIHPNRKDLDTQEVFGSITLNDSRIFRTAQPVLSPYIYGAYDVALYHGFYLEGGLKHDFIFEDIGFTLTPLADIAYVIDNQQYQLMPGKKNYGLQHYDVALIGTISLNHMFNVDRRYGEWSVRGYMYYTAGIDKQIRSDTLIWGGVGLEFRY